MTCSLHKDGLCLAKVNVILPKQSRINNRIKSVHSIEQHGISLFLFFAHYSKMHVSFRPGRIKLSYFNIHVGNKMTVQVFVLLSL